MPHAPPPSPMPPAAGRGALVHGRQDDCDTPSSPRAATAPCVPSPAPPCPAPPQNMAMVFLYTCSASPSTSAMPLAPATTSSTCLCAQHPHPRPTSPRGRQTVVRAHALALSPEGESMPATVAARLLWCAHTHYSWALARAAGQLRGRSQVQRAHTGCVYSGTRPLPPAGVTPLDTHPSPPPPAPGPTTRHGRKGPSITYRTRPPRPPWQHPTSGWPARSGF